MLNNRPSIQEFIFRYFFLRLDAIWFSRNFLIWARSFWLLKMWCIVWVMIMKGQWGFWHLANRTCLWREMEGPRYCWKSRKSSKTQRKLKVQVKSKRQLLSQTVMTCQILKENETICNFYVKFHSVTFPSQISSLSDTKIWENLKEIPPKKRLALTGQTS